MSPSAPIMEIRNLSKSFGSVLAVDNVSFLLRPGEVHGFIGPNGAGKTTTMRIMAGVEMPDDGDVRLDGLSVVDNPEQTRPRIGFMPDYLDSYPGLDVGEYLDFYSRLFGRRRERRRRLADVMEFVGLTPMLNRPVDGLSKGWKQRLSLARVLLNDPDVLILDEPAAGLDPRARVELRDLVILLADRGKAVFVSSHILTELSEMCQSVTIIEKGRLVVSSGVGEISREVDRGTRMAVVLLEPTPNNRLRLAHFLAAVPGVTGVTEGEAGVVFTHDGFADFKADLLVRLIGENFRITDYHSATSSLEDAFIVMTGGSHVRS